MGCSESQPRDLQCLSYYAVDPYLSGDLRPTRICVIQCGPQMRENQRIANFQMRPKSSCALTFILVNFKTPKQVRYCLQSLRPFQDELNCEFILVDNSPPDGSLYLADAGLADVQIISNSRNLGYATACNQGLRASRAPYVFFLNPDTEYISGSARELIEWLDRNPAVALVGPRILNPDGTRQFSARSFPDWTTPFSHRHSLLTRVLPNNPFTRRYLRADLDGKPTRVDWAAGCCLLARKKALEEVGGFDEGYFLFFEDVDLAYRLKARGLNCVYYPGKTFSHTIGASRAHLRDLGATAKHFSATRYFTKNVIRNKFLADLFAVGVSLRCLISTIYHLYWPGQSLAPSRDDYPSASGFSPPFLDRVE